MAVCVAEERQSGLDLAERSRGLGREPLGRVAVGEVGFEPGAPRAGSLEDRGQGLLELIGRLRESSQIVLITHQKRTMEIADALYGVTMRGDGVTEVISQRLRESA